MKHTKAHKKKNAKKSVYAMLKGQDTESQTKQQPNG